MILNPENKAHRVLALQNKLSAHCQSLIYPSSISTFSPFLTACAHTSPPMWLKPEWRESAQFKQGHAFQASNRFFAEKRMKTNCTLPTARPCEIPPGPPQQTTVISADACTEDNNAACYQSHCVPVILALHTIYLIKMSAALYRLSNSLSWRCQIPLSIVSCWIPGWKIKHNKSTHIPKCFSHTTSVAFTLFVGKGRKESTERMESTFFFLLTPLTRTDFITHK